MDIRKIMILIKGEDKTAKITSISVNNSAKKVKVVFGKRKTYTYNQSNVQILRNPRNIKLRGRVAYADGIPVYDPQEILDFGKHIRIINSNGYAVSVPAHTFLLVKNGADKQKVRQSLEYLKDISQYTNDKSGDEAFLKVQMDKLSFIHPDSVLSRYLNSQPPQRRKLEINDIIFPFRFNLSQKSALENALNHSISVIEGPPGTGKTQTILNILANLVAVQEKSVAVVSNNNEAVINVIDKLEEKGYGFLAAFLGNDCNQKAFFANKPIANVEGWNCGETHKELTSKIREINGKLNHLLYADRKRARFLQEMLAWQLEQEHFEEYFARQNVEEISKLPLFRATPDRIASFLAETTLAKERGQSEKLLHKLKLLFKYGVFDYEKLIQEELETLLSLQREFYRRQIQDLQKKISILDTKLENANFSALQKDHQYYSEKLFRKCLYRSHSSFGKPTFTAKNFKAKFKEFIQAYPIILSTTHSLRRSIPQDYLLDYVIIDESSMVDLITGTLAFSCCRNAIVVGDTRQLPQITNHKIKPKLQTAPAAAAFDYFEHNILSSVLSLYGDNIPREMLREHYRCHPRIIEFSNQKYYDGELIPYTSTYLSDLPLVLYLTSEGNHMRRITRGEGKGIYNQRELDVTVGEVLQNPEIAEDSDHVGFITPYRKQADKAAKLLSANIQSDTVHKYQGREKDVMIMSTVLDNTWDGQRGIDFADDPQLVNVAISRAIKQFVLVTDRDLFYKKGRDIGDLVRYIQYSTLDENVIESQIVSVFDLLYRKYSSKLQRFKAKMNRDARYKSEEALRVMLDELLAEPRNNRYSYTQGVLLRNLLGNTDLLTVEELAFVNHRASLDFVIFNKQDKTCALVIEVDGFAFHENNPDQLRRDAMKDAILEKYSVPILRLATNGSEEWEKIQNKLNSLYYGYDLQAL